MTDQKTITRLPGVLWLALAFAGGFGLFYVRNFVIVPMDASATIANVQASEFLYRLSITATLIAQVLTVFFAIELFRLFRSTSFRLALVLMLSFLLVAAFTVMNTLNHFAALLLLSQAEFLKGFTPEQITTAAYAFIRAANGPGQALIELFWPSAYISFGLLIIRSRIAPAIFGYLLMLMGADFALNLTNKFLFPWFYPAQFTQLAMLTGALGGIPNMLWFAIRGVPHGIERR